MHSMFDEDNALIKRKSIKSLVSLVKSLVRRKYFSCTWGAPAFALANLREY